MVVTVVVGYTQKRECVQCAIAIVCVRASEIRTGKWRWVAKAEEEEEEVIGAKHRYKPCVHRRRDDFSPFNPVPLLSSPRNLLYYCTVLHGIFSRSSYIV